MAKAYTYLATNQYLASGDYLTSPSGSFIAVMQGDGNLVVKFAGQTGAVIWATNTGGRPDGQYVALMQLDGNLAVYERLDLNQTGAALWATNTGGRAQGNYLVLLDDEALVVYEGTDPAHPGPQVWASKACRSPLANQRPTAFENPPAHLLLLTDGTVLCHENATDRWWKLTPDAYGSYVNGVWDSSPTSMQRIRLPDYTTGSYDDPPGTTHSVELSGQTVPYAPLAFASAVLADGRVLVAGGEYLSNPEWQTKFGNQTLMVDVAAAQIYDPRSDQWTTIPTPEGWQHIGDAPCCVLPDGRLLLGSIESTATALYDPKSNTWTPGPVNQKEEPWRSGPAKRGPAKEDPSSEETWTLLPDNSVLCVECTNHPSCEKYVVPTNQWVPAGQTPSDLVEAASIEIGPAILLPDGRVFAIGATGKTALYSPPPNVTDPGIWVEGPTFPSGFRVEGNQTFLLQLGAKDAPACLLPNGKVLCAVGPVDGQADSYLAPTYFYEFNPNLANPTLSPSATQPLVGTNDFPPFIFSLLLLPTGQVLCTTNTQNKATATNTTPVPYIGIYSPDGAYNPYWQPTIMELFPTSTEWSPTSTESPLTLHLNHVYTLKGTELNGLSQACSYGDDAQMATNYPLVRIHHLETNQVRYCRTFNHSTMGVATGPTVHSTQFLVPVGTALGLSELVVIANGIPSAPFTVTVTEAPRPLKW